MSERLTKERIEAIKARRSDLLADGDWIYKPQAFTVFENRTKGAWEVAQVNNHNDGAFIALAAQDIDALLAEVEALKAELAEARRIPAVNMDAGQEVD